MFPKVLDNAKVLWYTDRGDYGPVFYTTGEPCDRQAYFAICQYAGSSGCYLFSCNAAFEVLTDFPCDTAEECKQHAARWHAGLVWHAAE